MRDIIIVQKQSNDSSHVQARECLISHLNSRNLSFDIFTLDEIYAKKMSYFHPDNKSSGFSTAKNLVISLGGDGTLLHASHYIGGNVRLLGINSSPDTSVGYICALKPNDISVKLDMFLDDDTLYKSIQRLQICFVTSDNLSSSSDNLSSSSSDSKKTNCTVLPLCLNDALICHEHPAATTRIEASLFERESQKQISHYNIYSSGIWVSTVIGQTAAISSYGLAKKPKDSDSVFVVVREPYFPKNTESYPAIFQFHNQTQQLRILSKMRGDGLICIDGPDSCIAFKDGDTAIFNAPVEAVLKLAL